MYLVLASKSPRRRELLMNAGYSIRISPSDANEEVSEIYPEEKVLAIAKKKGIDVYEKYKNDERILAWNIINEPGITIGDRAIPIVKELFEDLLNSLFVVSICCTDEFIV